MPMTELEEIQLKSCQSKAERLKKATTNTKNVIKSPILNDPNRNPCIKEQNESRKCWLDNDFDKTRCTDHYDNYRICVRFWNAIEWERLRKGIKPFLPPPEERADIIKEKMGDIRKGEGYLSMIFAM